MQKLWLLSLKLSRNQSLETIDPNVWTRKNGIFRTTWLKQHDLLEQFNFCTVLYLRVLSKVLKQYTEKPKAKHFVLDDTMSRYEEKLYNQILLDESDLRQTCQNQSKIWAITNDSEMMVQYSEKTTPAKPESLIQRFRIALELNTP